MNVSRLIGLGDATKAGRFALINARPSGFVSLAGGYGSLNKSVKIGCRSGSKSAQLLQEFFRYLELPCRSATHRVLDE